MITIIIVPVGVRQRRFSDISFLGSILDKRSLRREFRNLHPHSLLGGHGSEKMFLPERNNLTKELPRAGFEKDTFTKKKPYAVSIDEILDVDKRLPDMAEVEESLESVSKVSGVEGEVRNRAILYKPSLPDYKTLLPPSEKNITGGYLRVRLKIIVSPDGSIKAVENLQTSGYPEIDLMAIRHVKKWKFVPLSPERQQGLQEGVVLLEFK